MKITNAMSDTAISSELFCRLEKRRKTMQITQQEMADRVGITRKSYAALKSGVSKLSTFIAILRQLELLDSLELIATPTGPSPMSALGPSFTRKEAQRLGATAGAAPQGSSRQPVTVTQTPATNPILVKRQRFLVKG